MSGTLSRDVVIVGASVAGLRAAEAVARVARELTVTVIGEEAHPPYDRRSLSKAALTQPGGLDAVSMRSVARLRDEGVDFRLGTRAVGLDATRRELHLEQGTISFGALVLACGCDPAVPALLASRPRVVALRRWENLLSLRAALAGTSVSVAVVGAGFIGGEVTSALKGSGRAVSLIDVSPQPLGRFGAFVAESYAALHEEAGTAQYFGDGVVDVLEERRGRFLRLSSGAQVPADVIVVSGAVRPSTGWLESSGLVLRDGIVCDAALRAHEGVFAAGDVARWFNPRYGTRMRVEHWTNAAEHGRIAGLNAVRSIVGGSAEACATVPYFWSDQHNVRIQFAGFLSGDERTLVQRTADGSIVLYGRDDQLVGVLAFEHRSLFVELRTMLGGKGPWDRAMELVGATISAS
ncbi:FAD/NAD(P)-binding oxidoreductase [Streptomyces bottropensis]|uniref:FAD-dependent oxidoreductase n=2 Tax=Streptomyces bottropensis TaxID=42235 RepID=M3FH19_9ACTN|nr:FAD/NAD(P)-binding oxidoreductase [Streptomyces bottropensis]EMF51294.1 FAD-dependent oxidoreductase [Streptomyces bottropensis ATCC 25435]MZD20646.1 FAD-dependent oxidoreductase [Streptomyces sp. SID5476]